MWRLVHEGSVRHIRALLQGSRCPAEEFIRGCSRTEKIRIVRLIERLGDKVMVRNTEKFKKLVGTEGLWELKPTKGIRLPGFFVPEGYDFVITHGFYKRRPRIPQKEIERAEALRRAFLERWKEGEHGSRR